MQKYNPNNPVYKYKSVKVDIPNQDHIESNKEEVVENRKLRDGYGLYVPPPMFEQGMHKAVTFLQYISFTLDTNDRDYTKYPNPFDFVSDSFIEEFKNVKIFQIFYLTLPQLNLTRVTLDKDPFYNFMLSLKNTGNLKNNDEFIFSDGVNPDILVSICNTANNELNFLINHNISLVFCIDNKNNYYSFGFSSTYKLNANPYVRLEIPQVIYSPVLSTDNKKYTYFVRMSRARNQIAYASVRSPTKVFKEQTLLNFQKLSFKFYDSAHQPLSIKYLDKYADPVNDNTNWASKYNYIRHPLFYYHQIIMGVRIGLIRNTLK